MRCLVDDDRYIAGSYGSRSCQLDFGREHDLGCYALFDREQSTDHVYHWKYQGYSSDTHRYALASILHHRAFKSGKHHDTKSKLWPKQLLLFV